MWRVLLSGLFCLPALVLLWLGLNDHSSQVSNAPVAASVVAEVNTVAPVIHISLPPVQFSTEPTLPDPDTWDSAGLTVRLPSQEAMRDASATGQQIALSINPLPPRSYLAMRRHTLKGAGRNVAELAATSKSRQLASNHSGLLAFLSQNLTRRSFALPDQNGGG